MRKVVAINAMKVLGGAAGEGMPRETSPGGALKLRKLVKFEM